MKLGTESALSSESPECPHCGSVITPDESYWYDEHKCGRGGAIDCGGCDKSFTVSVHASFHWTTRKYPPAPPAPNPAEPAAAVRP